jgi:hypothetical protein
VDALHNDPMGSAEFDPLQLAGAQQFIDSAATDIEHVGSAVNGNGKAIFEVDKLDVATFAHGDKNRRNLIVK